MSAPATLEDLEQIWRVSVEADEPGAIARPEHREPTRRWGPRAPTCARNADEFARAVEHERAQMARLGYVDTPAGRLEIGKLWARRSPGSRSER